MWCCSVYASWRCFTASHRHTLTLPLFASICSLSFLSLFWFPPLRFPFFHFSLYFTFLSLPFLSPLILLTFLLSDFLYLSFFLVSLFPLSLSHIRLLRTLPLPPPRSSTLPFFSPVSAASLSSSIPILGTTRALVPFPVPSASSSVFTALTKRPAHTLQA